MADDGQDITEPKVPLNVPISMGLLGAAFAGSTFCVAQFVNDNNYKAVLLIVIGVVFLIVAGLIYRCLYIPQFLALYKEKKDALDQRNEMQSQLHRIEEAVDTPRVDLAAMRKMLLYAAQAIQAVSNTPTEKHGIVVVKSWKEQFQHFHHHLETTLNALSNDKMTITSNVMLYVDKEKYFPGVECSVFKWTQVLNSVAENYLELGDTLAEQYRVDKLETRFEDICGELLLVVKSDSSKERDIRIPVHRDKESVLMGAPLIVDVLKEMHDVSPIETINTQLEKAKDGVKAYHDYCFIKYYPDTQNLKDTDFRANVNDAAKKAVRNYFKNDSHIHSLISIGIAPFAEVNEGAYAVLNINFDTARPFKGHEQVELLADYLLTLYGFALNDWLGGLWSSFDSQFKEYCEAATKAE